MLDHAVLAVGYGVSPSKQKYIIVKTAGDRLGNGRLYLHVCRDT